MEKWMIALLIFAAITVGMIAQGWVSLLEHKRRSQALDVIKAAIEAGRDAPPQVYEQLQPTKSSGERHWTEVVVFGALAVGFWIAYATATSGNRTAFLIIAATMTATSLGAMALALFRSDRGGRSDDRG